MPLVGDGFSLKTSSGNIAPGCEGFGAGVTIPKRDGAYDYGALTRCVRRLKQQNAQAADESQIAVSPNPELDYQVIVSTMDAVRADAQGPLFPDTVFRVPARR